MSERAENPRVPSTIDHVPADAPGSRIGPYKLLQQIGEGGMGVVFMAEQEQPVRRRVALKIIKPGMDSAQVVNRFRAEQQALALMDHQNIARVYDAGMTEGGRPYFVMELVHGVPITRYCDDAKLTPRERLDLFLPVCRAVQHAHQKGIIHRDLKPSNVLVCLYDGKPVAKVIDFGVAKAIEKPLTDGTVFTHFGQIIGTLEYMSPEQAEMSQLGIDTRSDIYSLGVMLYELLTGSTPLQRQRIKKAAFDEILKLIREEEPPPPSSRLSGSKEALPTISQQRRMDPAALSKAIKGELDWIVMKSLEKDRTRRYETADGLAKDIERYLTDEPVEAGPPSTAYRLRKYARKHRTLLTAAGAFALLLIAGTTISLWQAIRATKAESDAIEAGEKAKKDRDDAVQARDELGRTSEQMRDALYVADMNLVKSAYDSNQPRRALDLLERHRPEPGEKDLRGFEWFYWKRLLKPESEIVRLEGMTTTIDPTAQVGMRRQEWIAFAKSGRSCAAILGLDEGNPQITIWDPMTGKRKQVIPWEKASAAKESLGVVDIRFSEDESLLVVQSQSTQSTKGKFPKLLGDEHEFFALATGKKLYSLRGGNYLTGGNVYLHPDSARVLHIGGLSSVKGGEEAKKLMRRYQWVKWRDARTGKELSQFEIGTGWVVVSEDCRRIATVENLGDRKDQQLAICVYEASDGKLFCRVPIPHKTFGLIKMAFSPDGKKLALASHAAGGGLIAPELEETQFNPVVCINVEGGKVAWSSPLFPVQGNTEFGLVFSPRGDRVVLWKGRFQPNEPRRYFLLDADNGKLVKAVEHSSNQWFLSSFGPQHPPIAFSRDGSLWAAACDESCYVHSTRTGRMVAQPRLSLVPIMPPVFLTDGRHLLLWGGSGDVCRLDVSEWSIAAETPTAENDALLALDWSVFLPNDRQLITTALVRIPVVGVDREITVYDLATGKKRRSIGGSFRMNVAIDPFHDRVATVHEEIRILGEEEKRDRILKLDAADAKLPQELTVGPTLHFLKHEQGLLLREEKVVRAAQGFPITEGLHRVSLLDLKTGDRISSWWDALERVRRVEVSPDGEHALIAWVARPEDTVSWIKLAEVATGKAIWKVTDLDYKIGKAVFNSDGTRVFLQGFRRDGIVRELRDGRSGKLLWRNAGGANPFSLLKASFSPDSRRLVLFEAVGGDEVRLRILDQGGNEVCVLSLPDVVIYSAELSRDGTKIRALRLGWEQLPPENWVITLDATPLPGDEKRAPAR